ncbi:MAG: monovalent cation/H(+) antiporter subunit G [Anaerolineales bacterium]|jgi:multicomponent Na+:H+ antiporter subunit G
MQEILIMLLMLLGAVLIFLAGVGILRMPDIFLRMSATAKAGTLGVGLILTAAALHFNEFGIYTRVVAIICFILLTAPIAAHIIGRAAYFDGVPLWEGTIQDDLKKHYRISDHALYSGEIPPEEILVPQKEADDFSEEPE